MERNYKNDLQIDTSDLEGEWTEQPSHYMYYAEQHADAVLLKDRRKQRLEVVFAELDTEYRKKWERISDQKMTEQAIKSKIYTDDRYKKAQRLLNKATHDVNILASAKTAFEHRKKALENHVTLLVTGFHSEPKTKGPRGSQQSGGDKQRKRALNKDRKTRRM